MKMTETLVLLLLFSLIFGVVVAVRRIVDPGTRGSEMHRAVREKVHEAMNLASIAVGESLQNAKKSLESARVAEQAIKELEQIKRSGRVKKD